MILENYPSTLIQLIITEVYITLIYIIAAFEKALSTEPTAITPSDPFGEFPLRRLINHNLGNEEWDPKLRLPVLRSHPYPCGLAHHLLQRSRQYHSPQESGFTDVHLFNDRFEVKLDLHNFRPEELDVTTVRNYIIVEGKHVEEDPHGSIPRTFKLRYFLPDNVKWENIFCNLSPDGILTITVRRVEDTTDADGKPILPPPM